MTIFTKQLDFVVFLLQLKSVWPSAVDEAERELDIYNNMVPQMRRRKW